MKGGFLLGGGQKKAPA
jgi:hypothetical protein